MADGITTAGDFEMAPLLFSSANPRSPDPENRDFDSPNEEQQQQQQQEPERERPQREPEDANKRSKEAEKEMNEALDSGDFEEIMKRITPQKLTECTTNCIEKSFEVSHRLKTLGKSKGPKAEEFNNLATQVEDFAFKLVEPLKNDDVKRAIFKEHCFDSVSDKALNHRQKKYVSHPLYDLMMRQQWMGDFYQLKYSNVKKTLLKWFLLNFWTFFDVFLFPLVHVLLWGIHLIIEFAKKRQGYDLSVGFMFHDPWEPEKTQEAADDFEKKLKREVKVVKRVKVEEVIRSKKGIELPGKKKVLLAMTTGVRYGAPSNKLLEAVTLLKKKQKCKVISVGYVEDIHLNHHCTHFKYLETMATNDRNVFFIFDGDKDKDKDKDKDTVILKDILTCIKGKDIYDRYVQYFKTPYFIFFRETLSYLALLGLHFAMCLQPSTLHFTAVEWIISVFFLGRLMMEINQLIMEKNSDWTEINDLSQQDHKAKQKPKQDHEAKEKPKEEEEEEEEEGGGAGAGAGAGGAGGGGGGEEEGGEEEGGEEEEERKKEKKKINKKKKDRRKPKKKGARRNQKRKRTEEEEKEEEDDKEEEESSSATFSSPPVSKKKKCKQKASD